MADLEPETSTSEHDLYHATDVHGLLSSVLLKHLLYC